MIKRQMIGQIEQLLVNKVYRNGVFILTFFFFGHKAFAQNITPYAMNNGGGYSSSMDWSISESTSIANFITPTYSLNTGVLQPINSTVTVIDPNVALLPSYQITIGPNPTANLLHIKTKFNELGNLLLQLTDAKSALVFSKEVSVTSSSYENDITMEQYASGVFFLRVYYKPIKGNAKTATYKIIKL
jgi:hypothetical protein